MTFYYVYKTTKEGETRYLGFNNTWIRDFNWALQFNHSDAIDRSKRMGSFCVVGEIEV